MSRRYRCEHVEFHGAEQIEIAFRFGRMRSELGSMPMSFPPLHDVRPFMGYTPEDYPRAVEFYEALGFTALNKGPDVTPFDTGLGQRFIVSLHHGYDRDNAGMMHLWAKDVNQWQQYLEEIDLAGRFPEVEIAEPTVTDWGWRILYVWDPGGWLLHIAEPHSEESKAAAARWIDRA